MGLGIGVGGWEEVNKFHVRNDHKVKEKKHDVV